MPIGSYRWNLTVTTERYGEAIPREGRHIEGGTSKLSRRIPRRRRKHSLPTRQTTRVQARVLHPSKHVSVAKHIGTIGVGEHPTHHRGRVHTRQRHRHERSRDHQPAGTPADPERGRTVRYLQARACAARAKAARTDQTKDERGRIPGDSARSRRLRNPKLFEIEADLRRRCRAASA